MNKPFPSERRFPPWGESGEKGGGQAQQTGILSIAKSKPTLFTDDTLSADLNTPSAFCAYGGEKNEIKDKSNKKSDLLHCKSEVFGAKEVECKRASEVVSVSRWDVVDSGRVLTKSRLVKKTLERPLFANFDGWSLVGHGEPYFDCGEFGWKGCLNVDHHHERIDNPGCREKVFVKGYRRSCGRAECPICFEKWGYKQAVRAERRLKFYRGGYRKAVHITVSVPECDYSLDYRKLRERVMLLLKRSGFRGGSLIPHPFREDARGWYLSWHFHAVGYGWILGTKNLYEESGYVIKNIGVRKTVRGTIFYQLSHAGFNKKHHVLTWFGELAYNKLRIPKQEGGDREVCPLCGEKLVLLKFVSIDRPPPSELEGEFYLCPEGWMPKFVSREFV